MDIFKLEEYKEKYHSRACIYGAGKRGTGVVYYLARGMGLNIISFCDKYVNWPIEKKTGIVITTPEELKNLYEDCLVIVSIDGPRGQEILMQIKKEIPEADVEQFDDSTISEILNDISHSSIEIREKYKQILDDKLWLNFLYQEIFGKDINWESPKTFNEKLQWLKVYDRNPQYVDFVDKISFKKYVVENYGEQYIVPTIGIYDSFDEIKFSELPMSFVIKCNHDSGGVKIIDDKHKANIAELNYFFDKRIKLNYFWGAREWPYKEIKPQIVVEKYLGDTITDYKVMCFGGEPKLIFTCTERNSAAGLKVTFFDINWNKMNFERHYPSSTHAIQKPKHLDEMLDLAKDISRDIPFVRVDFYEIEDRIYFGELTFYPGAGFEEFSPEEWDEKLGDMIVLSNVS